MSNSSTRKSAVYFFCCDREKDPVAAHIFKASNELFNLTETQIVIDDQKVLKYTSSTGDFYYVRTNEVLSHDYKRYLPIMNKYFSNADFAGLVNWHEGENAPDPILTIHTTADIVSGNFGVANPLYLRNLLLCLERNRLKRKLDDFTVLTEATHWSGVMYGEKPEQILEYPVPIMDIEIGSTVNSFSNRVAAEIVAASLVELFDQSGDGMRSLLCAGGVHFEPSFCRAILDNIEEYPIAVSHILPNQWLVSGNYDNEDGLKKLEACVRSIEGGIDGIVFHDKLKGTYKANLRLLAEKLSVPYFKHQSLRQPEKLPIW